MRISLDASVWIAGLLSSRGASRALIEELEVSDAVVLIAPATIAEIVRNLQKKATRVELEAFTEWYGRLHPELVRGRPALIRKAAAVIIPKDALILAAAIAGQADLLVTLDRRHFFKPTVRRFAEPLELLNSREALHLLRKL